MAISIDGQVPKEVGYTVVPAMVVETSEMGEVWIVGAIKVEDGYLAEQDTY
jgi:hypothetical protein